MKLIERTGVNDVVDMAVRLGMRQLLTQQVPRTGGRNYAEVIKAQQQASFTLGVNPTSVLELANVGATLASGGKWCPPTPIESITDPDGQPVPFTETPCDQVVEPGLANTLLHGLSKDDNDFVVGLIGKELYPLSAIVQTMRKTQQTSLYLERLGPFFVGRAVWQSPA